MEDDWDELKKFFLVCADEKDKRKRISQMEIWAEALRAFGEACPDLSNVIEFLMIIPSSTATVERFFKTLKAMKSKLRNRLSSIKLKKLFMIHHFLDLKNYDLDRVHEIFKVKLQERVYVKSIQDKKRRAERKKVLYANRE